MQKMVQLIGQVVALAKELQQGLKDGQRTKE